MLGLASGALAGLVGITPACAYVGVGGALAIGLLCGIFCYLSVTVLKKRFGYDDSLDVFGLHGIGGMIGAVLTGVFCVPSLGGLVEDVTGGRSSPKSKAYCSTTVYCFAVSWVILKVIKAMIGLRAESMWRRWGWIWLSTTRQQPLTSAQQRGEAFVFVYSLLFVIAARPHGYEYGRDQTLLEKLNQQ